MKLYRNGAEYCDIVESFHTGEAELSILQFGSSNPISDKRFSVVLWVKREIVSEMAQYEIKGPNYSFNFSPQTCEIMTLAWKGRRVDWFEVIGDLS